MTSVSAPQKQAAEPLDRHVPTFHFRERHAVTISASPEAVYRAIQQLTPAEMPLTGVLFWLRALPARVLGRRYRSRVGRVLPADIPIVQAALNGGFVLLEEEPGSHLVLGTIGKFWQLSGGAYYAPDSAAFHAFADPAYARAAMDFQLHPLPGTPPLGTPLPGTSLPGATPRVRLTTETRIQTPSDAARRRFALYWRLIYPGSALIRLLCLRAIKRRAERTAA